MTPASGGPARLIGAGLLLIMTAAAVGTPADADLWGEVVFGQAIVSTGYIPLQDSYSFTSDREWVNHEWLSAIVFYLVYRGGGAAGLILLKLVMLSLLLGILFLRFRGKGASVDSGVLLVAVAFTGTYWRMHTIRPQLFSVVLFTCLLAALTAAESGRRRFLWTVPPLFALWVNLHGAWIVGYGMLGVWIAFELIRRQPRGLSRPALIALGVTSAAATLINPYGPRMWVLLAETVRLDRSDIQDWAPLWGDPIALGIPWILTAVAAVIAMSQSRPPVREARFTMAVLLATASVRVSRLDAFFAVSVMVLFAPGLVAAANRLLRSGIQSSVASRARDTPATPRQRYAAAAITALAGAAILIPLSSFFGRYATCLTIGGGWPPEPEAARFVSANHLRGRMVTFFDWGEYAIFHFTPDIKVSMDGRRETVYSADMITTHWRFYDADPEAIARLTEFQPDYVWVPKQRPIASRLPSDGWRPIFMGPRSVIFARDSMASFRQVEPLAVGQRCFPGP